MGFDWFARQRMQEMRRQRDERGVESSKESIAKMAATPERKSYAWRPPGPSHFQPEPPQAESQSNPPRQTAPRLILAILRRTYAIISNVATGLIRLLRSSETIQGVASHIATEPLSEDKLRLTFRLERYDERGSRDVPVPVEMRGGKVKGQLLEGDELEIVVGRVRGGMLRPRRILNLRTGQRVRMGPSNKRIINVISYGIIWSILAVIIAFAIIAISG